MMVSPPAHASDPLRLRRHGRARRNHARFSACGLSGRPGDRDSVFSAYGPSGRPGKGHPAGSRRVSGIDQESKGAGQDKGQNLILSGIPFPFEGVAHKKT